MKILITGGSGLLGQYLNIYLSRENEILTLFNNSYGNCKDYNNHKIDLTNFDKVTDVFKSFHPEILIHTAAISRPEECDSIPHPHVMNVNFHLNEILTELCNEYNCRLIFTSTDLVYDGETGIISHENSIIKPVSLYAETKLLSEDHIRKTSENYVILRTSLLYGVGLNGSLCNFHIMLNKFKAGESVRLFYDQYRTPLSLHNAAELIFEIIEKDVSNITLNFGGRERISRCELGEMVCRKFGYDNSLIEKISLSDIDGIHKVYDVSMNTDLLNSLGIYQMNIEKSLDKIFRDSEF